MEKSKLSNRFCPEGMSVEEWQVALRHEFALTNNFRVEHIDQNRIWGDYFVYSGPNRYRVAFRGVRSERNYCSCLDFRTNGLGTCKHLEAVSIYLQEHEEGYPWAHREYIPRHSSLYVSYKGGRSVRLSIGLGDETRYESFRRKYFGEDFILKPSYYDRLEEIYNEGLNLSEEFRCYNDVWEYVEEVLCESRWRSQLLNRFPTRDFSAGYASECQSLTLREEMFALLLQGNGLLVGDMTSALRCEILAMIEYISAEEKLPTLLIAADNYSVTLWKKEIQNSPLKQTNIQVVPMDQFSIKERYFAPNYGFIFVENADTLKEWHGQVSITIKRLNIKHLYMQLPTINHLTPVQFSSIAQHISPYIVGPFYSFIRDHRPLFPLSDNGENLPDIVRPFVFTRIHTATCSWSDRPQEEVSICASKTSLPSTNQWLEDTIRLLQNETTRNQLIDLLKHWTSSHDKL